MFDFKGKNVLVTGASGGIGRAIATIFAKNNATVIITGTKNDKLQELQQQLKPNCYAIKADLSDKKQLLELIAKYQENVGDIDVLINNAGINADCMTLRLKIEDWQKVMDVNLTANFILSKAVLRNMSRKKFGRIINISSVIANTGNAGQAAYAASKSALFGLTKSLAREFAKRGITVNCIAPGYVDTPMTQVLNENIKKQIVEKIPVAAIAQPEDIAVAAIYLASDYAGYITGETININGGMDMR